MFSKVALIGANGSMGAKIAAIVASFGDAQVYMVARDIQKAKNGVEIAVKSIRTNSIRKNLIPTTFARLPSVLKDCDWVIEAVSENYETKNAVGRLIAQTQKKGRYISSITSGLSITKLSKVYGDEDRKRFTGVHFFNPPYKMLLCEVVTTEFSDNNSVNKLITYLEGKLSRVIVRTKDTPAFAANRVGFQLMNEAVIFAEKYKHRGGIAYIDSLIGPHTGRTIPPLETMDFVGLDVHEAIVDNLYENTNDDAKKTFMIPKFLKKIIKNGGLGNKSGRGLYTTKLVDGKKVKYSLDIKTGKYVPYISYEPSFIRTMRRYIRCGEYQQAIDVLMTAKHQDADIVRYFIARYISYALSLVGTVVEKRDNVDEVMAHGFGWLPPSALVDLLGGVKNAVQLIKNHNLVVPNELLKQKKSSKNFYELQEQIDYRSFLKA